MNKKAMGKILKTLEKQYPMPNFSREKPYEALIGTVLSQRTLDQTTDRVSQALFKAADSPKALVKMTERQIARIIRPINFYKTKAKRLKQIANIIVKEYGGRIPRTREELMSLPGVGPKTADAVLSFSYGKQVIPIDTHVQVVSERIGISDEKDDYNKIQAKLNALVPERKRDSVNYLLVEHGKKICRKHLPKCGACVINKFCRYYNFRAKKHSH